MKIEDIKIDEEFKNLLPALSDDELKQLRDNIVETGEIREPLIVWEKSLIDGYNRLDVWNNLTDEERKKVAKPSITLVKFSGRKEALAWIIRNQLGRRNLTSKQRAYLIGSLYNTLKKDPSQNLKNAKKPLKTPNGENCRSTDSAETVGKKFDKSPRQVRDDGKFTAALETIESTIGSEAKSEVLNGGNKIPKAKVIEIAGLPEEKQKAAFERAMGRGTPSGGNSFEPAEWGGTEESKGVKDGLGCVVPNEIAEHFTAAEGLTEVLNLISQAKKKLNALCKKTCCYEIKFQNVESDLKNAVQQIKPYAPFTECPRCRRKLDKKCDLCKGTGFISHAKHGSGKGGGVLTSEEKEWLKNRA